MEQETCKEDRPKRPTSKAPPPIKPLRHSYRLTEPKATRAPLDFPPYYPDHLKLRTTVIIGEALKNFPVQTQTLELCKYVISKLTPHFCSAVRAGVLRADLAQSRMSDLLDSLLVYNCADSSERIRLNLETRKSDEWFKLAGKMARIAAASSPAPVAKRRVSRPEHSVEKPKGLSHSEGYASVTMPNGKQFTLTGNQARVIEVLDKAWLSGNPDVNKSKILDILERETSRPQDIFKSTPGAWKALIKSTRRGVYRLNLPDPPVSHT
jgi:hypothetical protein